jgi:HEAT repeat protein
MSNQNATNLLTPDRSAVARRFISFILGAVLLVLAVGFAVQAGAQALSSRNALNRLAQQGGSDAASVVFRGGRDLITEQQWQKAEEKFREYVAGFPNEKNIDAALYWQAYSEYQLRNFDQCKTTLNLLLNNYQKSSWKDDARTLLAQIPESGGSGVGVGVGRGRGVGVRVAPPPVLVQGQVRAEPQVALPPRFELMPMAPMPPVWEVGDDDWEPGRRGADDNDPCEFKIVVLQALFQSDVQRGISAASEWLAAGSTQTVRCKSAALSLLARNGGKSVTPVILGIARNEPDKKLRVKAISVLGNTGDESVIDPLRDFVLNSQENEIAEAALYALGQHSGARAVPVLSEIAISSRPASVRRYAISSIASRPGEPSVDALLKIYDGDQTVEIRKYVIAGFGHRKSERAGAKLLEIARGSDNIEFRKAAVSAIATRGGDKALDTLLGLYDSEKSEEVRDRILSAIGSSNDPRVTDKLIEIAKNPQSPMERRRRAIGWLSRRNDPKVTNFLQELLNK